MRHPSRLALSAVLLLGCGGVGVPSDLPDVASSTDAAPDASPLDVSAPRDAPVASDTVTPADAPADAPARRCLEPSPCDLPPPDPGPAGSWRHSIATPATTILGAAQHRGRDLFLREGDPQWVLGKFAYGIVDSDLDDEDVDLYLLRGCAAWERLATVRTTDGSTNHATVEGVDDHGGQVYYPIPAARRLGVGRHRVRFVVRGDLSVADAYITVLPAGARVVVSDVDGTLTESETAEWGTLFGGASPAAQPGGADMLWAFARRGYHVFYLTARPAFLATRTHQWLNERGFPPGVVHTTLGLTGALGGAATTFKAEELNALINRLGYAPDYAFGNTDTDVAAYALVPIVPSHAYYYQLAGDLRGGQRVDDYRTLVAGFAALPPVCP
jgi:hypothetical protein